MGDILFQIVRIRYCRTQQNDACGGIHHHRHSYVTRTQLNLLIATLLLLLL